MSLTEGGVVALGTGIGTLGAGADNLPSVTINIQLNHDFKHRN